MPRWTAALPAVLVLAVQTADGGCQATGVGYACHVETRGLEVEDARVTDVVRNWCDPGQAPQEQTFLAWIETRLNPGDDWLVSGRTAVSYTVPDPDGVIHRLRDGRCQADVEYGTAWRARGTDREGMAFDTGTVRRLSGATGLC